MVLLNEIGEGSNALYCLTNREERCCGPNTGGTNRGIWRFAKKNFALHTRAFASGSQGSQALRTRLGELQAPS